MIYKHCLYIYIYQHTYIVEHVKYVLCQYLKHTNKEIVFKPNIYINPNNIQFILQMVYYNL